MSRRAAARLQPAYSGVRPKLSGAGEPAADPNVFSWARDDLGEWVTEGELTDAIAAMAIRGTFPAPLDGDVVSECGVRSNGVLVPGRFEAMGQALLGVLGLHTLRSMSVCVLVAPLDGAAELRGLMACLFGLGAARLRLLDAAVAVLAAFDGPDSAGETVGTVLSVEYDGVCAACVAGGKRLPLPERPRR